MGSGDGAARSHQPQSSAETVKAERANSRYLEDPADGERAKDKMTMGNSMRRVPPQLIVVAVIGITFGMVYRYFLDDPSETSVANYLRSGVHGMSVAFVGWGANR